MDPPLPFPSGEVVLPFTGSFPSLVPDFSFVPVATVFSVDVLKLFFRAVLFCDDSVWLLFWCCRLGDVVSDRSREYREVGF